MFAEIVEETPGALWTRELIERHRFAPEAAPGDYVEMVVGVDPPATSAPAPTNAGSSSRRGRPTALFDLLADLTSQGDTPAAWAARVVAAYRRFSANRVVAEVNQGGDMAADVLRQCEANLPVASVTRRAEVSRAEPIAATYERGLVLHVGVFSVNSRTNSAL